MPSDSDLLCIIWRFPLDYGCFCWWWWWWQLKYFCSVMQLGNIWFHKHLMKNIFMSATIHSISIHLIPPPSPTRIQTIHSLAQIVYANIYNSTCVTIKFNVLYVCVFYVSILISQSVAIFVLYLVELGFVWFLFLFFQSSNVPTSHWK